MGLNVLPPVIIMGMHRSGTSMITRMLEMLGLFVGKKKQQDHEAFFFVNINDWLFNHSGGRWDYPEPIHYLLKDKEVRVLVVDYIKYLMKTPHVVSFLGWGKYVHYHTLFNLDFPWGWKDPRNTYTLPLWLDIFPDAKVVHIYRHGVDVANSLIVRRETLLTHAKELYKSRKLLYWFRQKTGYFTDTVRCASLEGAFSLWEEYIEEARKNIHESKKPSMEIKYEDFLTEPYLTLKSLASFCSLQATDVIIAKAAEHVKKERAYAYKDDVELNIFSEQVVERLRKKGY